MKIKCIPAKDVLAAHERAAREIGELRRKGVHCHLDQHADAAGPHVDVAREEPAEVEQKDSQKIWRSVRFA